MTRVPSPCAAVVALLALAACSPGGEPVPGPSPTTASTTSSASLDCPDASLLGAPAEALAVFPDFPEVTWTARPSEAVLGDLVLVLLTPEPDVVGYPEVQFVYRCDTAGPSRIATYALEDEAYVLLATTDALGAEELPETLP